MYKDKEKAKQASKERMRRYRAKGVTKEQGVTPKGVTSEGVTTQGVTLKGITVERAAKLYGIPNYGEPDCECMHCQQNRRTKPQLLINHGPYKPASQSWVFHLANNEINRVTLLGMQTMCAVQSMYRRSNSE